MFHQMAREIMLVLASNVHEKTSLKVKTEEIWKCVYAICNLHSCYNFALVLQLYTCYARMHWFSASQKCVIFFMYITNNVNMVC